jgi:hypothetical protein
MALNPENRSAIAQRTRKPLATVAALGVTIATAAGCSGPSSKNAAPTPTAATAPTQAATESASFNSLAYQTDPTRGARLQSAVNKFGPIVIAQSRARNSVWGKFDGFCGPGKTFGSLDQGYIGYTSQGYQLEPNENCMVQHSPAKIGEGALIEADVLIGEKSTYTNTFAAAVIDDPKTCTASIMKMDSGGWEVMANTDGATVSPTTDTNYADTLVEAQHIDNLAIACLVKTAQSINR